MTCCAFGKISQGLLLTFSCLIYFSEGNFASPRPNEVVLMDSRETDWKGWLKNTPTHIGWRQQSRAGTGYRVFGLCETVQKADVIDGRPVSAHLGFWLFSPPIHLGWSLSVHAQIYFMLRSCSDRELSSNLDRCQEHFDLYLQQKGSSSSVELDPNFVPNESSFKKLATISSDTKWRADTSQSDAVTSWLIRFRPINENGWIRFAIRDQGACLMLDRIRIYHLSCPAWQVGFMRLPETAAGHDAEVREVVGTCVSGSRSMLTSSRDNSSLGSSVKNYAENGSDMLKSSFCKANGKWHVNSEQACECLPGYEASVESSTCSSCPRSTYKSFAGLGVCRLCPPNSKPSTSLSAIGVARRRCDCAKGHFWLQEEGVDFGVCTQTLPMARNIKVIDQKPQKVVLGWDNWITDQTIFFSIRCNNCAKDSVAYLPSNIVNSSRVTIVGLLANTKYVISVRTCRRPLDTVESCSTSPAQLEINLTGEDKDENLHKTFSSATFIHPKEEFQTIKKGDGSTTPEGKISLITWFHILLGVAVFICMTLLFVFLGILIHRKSKRRMRIDQFGHVAMQGKSVYSPHVKGIYNSLEQLGLPVSAAFHQIVSIDQNAIEITFSLGKGRFGDLFAGTINRKLVSIDPVYQTTLARRNSPPPQDGQDNRLLAMTPHCSPEHFSACGESSSVFIRAVQVLRVTSQSSATSLRLDELCSQLLTSAHLASRFRHPHIIAFHGMVKLLEPKLLVYERLHHGRLKDFLQNELNKIDQASPSSHLKSGLLSTRTVFQMLQQISSAISYLARQSIPGLIINSKSIMVGVDFLCKVEIQLWRREVISNSRKLSADHFVILNLQKDLCSFLELGEGGNTEKIGPSKLGSELPQISNMLISKELNSLDLYHRLLLAAIPPCPPEGVDDPLVQESIHVWYFGCLQLEVLLASAFGQRSVLRKRIKNSLDNHFGAGSLKMSQLQRLSGAGSSVEYALCENAESSSSCLTSDWLRDVILMYISTWFSNDILAQVLQASLSSTPQLRPKFTALERHLVNYATMDKQKQVTRKVSRAEQPIIAAIIHESAFIPNNKGKDQSKIAGKCQWNNFLQPDSPNMQSDLV